MKAPKKTKKTKMPKGTLMKKDVKFDLTEAEFASKGKEAAGLSKEISKIEIEFEGVKDDFKAKIKDREAKRDTLLAVIHEGKETRNVEVLAVKNYTSATIEYWFEGTMVEKRAMTEHELQMELELNSKKKAPTKGKTKKPTQQELDKACVATPGLEAKTGERQAVTDEEMSEDIRQVMREETGRKTKLSAVDSATA